MNATLPPAWTGEKQRDLTEMEWEWRLLDERAGPWYMTDRNSRNARAMREKELEAGRLRAELAVAAFIEEFYVSGMTSRGQALIASADLEVWKQPELTRQQLAHHVMTEVEALSRGNAPSEWAAPISVADATLGHWWVDVDARELTGNAEQRHYRFHVVYGVVDAWIEFDHT